MQLTYTLEEIDHAVQALLPHLSTHHIIAFSGEMGAGKTTLIRHLCAQLGIQGEVNSPSFALVNEYQIAQSGQPVYHFDFYRIKSLEEVYDFGLEEYLESGHLCFLEWPELIEDLLPESSLCVQLALLPDGRRTIIINS